MKIIVAIATSIMSVITAWYNENIMGNRANTWLGSKKTMFLKLFVLGTHEWSPILNIK